MEARLSEAGCHCWADCHCPAWWAVSCVSQLVLMALKRCLEGLRIISAEVWFGSYLPNWRPDRDYRSTASVLHSAIVCAQPLLAKRLLLRGSHEPGFSRTAPLQVEIRPWARSRANRMFNCLIAEAVSVASATGAALGPTTLTFATCKA